MARRSHAEIRETLARAREARDALSDRPERQQQADQHVRLLEGLLSGREVKGNPNLSANAIVLNAKDFLYDWDDYGFVHDDQPEG